jgi:hypothetical protein
MRLSAVLIDLSGTLHVGSSPLPGAVQALARLRRHPSLKVSHAASLTHLARYCYHCSMYALKHGMNA